MLEKYLEGIYYNHPLMKKDIIKHRQYQIALAEKGLEESTLIVLPTGLGKTVIALFVIAETLLKKKGKILFLAPTKPLVNQHYEFLSSVLKAEIGLITGSISTKKRSTELSNCEVICATPQTFSGLSKEELGAFDLIIFDEAHKAAGAYAYVDIAKKTICKTLGLTASPGNEKSKIKAVMDNLRFTNIELKRKTDADIAPYTNPVNVQWIKVELPEQYKLIQSSLDSYAKEVIHHIQRYGFALRSQCTQSEILMLQRKVSQIEKKESKDYQAMMYISALLKTNHASLMLETQGVQALEEYFHKLKEDITKSAGMMQKDERIQKAIYLTEGFNLADINHPKLQKLIEIVLFELNRDPKQKIIVFNHYRDSVKHLESILQKNPLLSVKRFVGQANKEDDKGLNQKEQKEIIDDFKDGKYNILITTSVAEEGLDLPAVDTIVFYEPVPSEIRMIQRRGRTGRFKSGKVYILITKDTKDEIFYWSSLKKEKKMETTIDRLSKKESVNDKINGIVKPKEIKQTTLLTTIDSKKKLKPTIIIDHRERNAQALSFFNKEEVDLEFETLDIGDYLVGQEAVIERKKSDDFLNSILDNRLFTQASKLIAYEKPIIIVEGILDYESRNINKNAVLGSILSLSTDFKIPIFFIKTPKEVAEFITLVAKREQTKKENELHLRKVKKGVEDHILQRSILEGLPFVGPTLAKRLLEKYKSVKRVFNASEDSLQNIDKLGEKKAKKIYDIINKEYENTNQ